MERPRLLESRIGELKALLRLVLAAGGLGRTLCLAGALVALDLLLDRALRFRFGTRLVLLCAGAAAVLWQVGRGVLHPLLRRLTDHAVALELERRRPCEDLLASALSFAGGAAGGGSAALRREVLARAEREAAGIVPPRLLRWQRPRRWLLFGAAVALVTVGFGLAYPRAAGLWFRRNVLLRPVEWPRRTRLALVGFQEGVRFVPRAEDVQVSARASGVVPQMVSLVVRPEEGGRARELPMGRREAGRFSVTVPAVRQALSVRARGGDGISQPGLVQPVARPELAAARLTVRLPDYIRRTPLDIPWRSEGLQVPVGSRLSVELTATSRLSRAAWRLGRGEAQPMLMTGPRTARCSLEVNRDLICRFEFADVHGIGSAEPVKMDIRALPDEPPQVRLAARGAPDMVTPDAAVVLEAQALDDYGLSRLWLETAHRGGDGAAELPTAELWSGSGRREVWREHLLDLRHWELPPAGRLELAAAARDNRPDAEAGVARSAAVSLRLVTDAELVQALLLRQEDLRRDLEQLIATQREIVADLTGEADADLEQLSRRQAALASETGRVGAGYDQVLEQMLSNRVIEPTVHRRRRARIVEPLEELAAPDGPVMRAAITLRRRDASAAEPARSVLNAMERVRANMLLMEGYAAVTASVREVRRGQQDVLETTRRAGREEMQ